MVLGTLLEVLLQAVCHEVAAHLGFREEQRRVRRPGLEDAERRQGTLRLEVVVGFLGAGSTLATAGKRADEHGGLGVQGQTQRLLPLRCRLAMHRLDVGKDGIGLFDFFQRAALAHLRSR